MMHTTRLSVALGLISLALAGCSLVPKGEARSAAETLGPTPVLAIIAEGTVVNTSPAQGLLGNSPTESVDAARHDLASRLNLPLDSISVETVLGQDFTSEAFNCRSSKDRVSAVEPPASISGTLILLKASGQRYEYHASGATVLFCRALD